MPYQLDVEARIFGLMLTSSKILFKKKEPIKRLDPDNLSLWREKAHLY